MCGLKLSVTRSIRARVGSGLRWIFGCRSRSCLREAVRRGLPALVNDVVYLRSQGYRSPRPS